MPWNDFGSHNHTIFQSSGTVKTLVFSTIAGERLDSGSLERMYRGWRRLARHRGSLLSGWRRLGIECMHGIANDDGNQPDSQP